MSNLKEKAFWIAFGDIIGRGLAFFTSIYLARTLGSEFYGLIIISISVLGYATWFSDLGLINIGVREVAKEPIKRTFRVKEIFNLKVFLAAIVVFLAVSFIPFFPMGAIQKQVVIGYLYSIIPYAVMMEWFFNGKQHFGRVAFSRIVNGIVYFLLVIFFVKQQEDITLVPMLYTIGVTSAALLLGTFALIEKPFALPSRGFQIYPDLLRTGSVLGLGWFFSQVVQLLPPILIGIFLSLKDAGIYGAAFRIIVIIMMLDRVFVNLLLPNLATVWERDKKDAKVKIDMVLRIISTGGAFFALIFALNSDFIIQLLYGELYSESVLLLQILTLFVYFTFLNSLFSFGLIAVGKDKSYFFATCIGGSLAGVIIFLCASLGTPLLITASVVLAELIITFSTYYYFKKSVSAVSFKTLFLPLLFGVSIFLLSFIDFVSIAALNIIALFVFPFLMMVFNIVTEREVKWVISKIKL